MSGADFQIIPLHTIGRTILSLRPPIDQCHAAHQPEATAADLEAFQKQVSELFVAISASSPDELLSLPWLRNLLEIFVLCQEDFRILLLNNKSSLAKPSMEKIIDDFYDRSVKALDVCNAIRDGIEEMIQWQKLLEIVFNSLSNDNNGRNCTRKNLGEGQVRRAKKALDDLVAGMSEETGSNPSTYQRNRSLGGNQSGKERRSLSKSLSWSVSRSWSASRQLQAIACNLSAPKGNDVNTAHGLAAAIYTMNCVLFIVMWSLVAAIPCQDRGIQSHLTISRQFSWAAPILSIYEKIMQESKKRERKNACGLLKEIFAIEKWLSQMTGVVESLEFPVAGEKEGELRSKVQELQEVFDVLKVGLEPLERQVRQVFHMIVRSRIQGLDCFQRSCNACKHKKPNEFQGLDQD